MVVPTTKKFVLHNAIFIYNIYIIALFFHVRKFVMVVIPKHNDRLSKCSIFAKCLRRQ